ncbi:MAG TPA: VWA domain-containing protein [Acidimicrobiia bacterium]|nr:VWA domain-containing protein [Acidimicrobiia bacterium]
MTFLEPARLALLVLPLLAGVAYLISMRRREQYAVRFTNLELLDKVAPERPGWRRHVPAAVLLAGLVVLVLAVAKPATAVQVPRERATVALAVDVSLSMEADDVDPSRIAAAQAAARNFVELAPEELEIGIVAFSGVAVPVLPPTVDRNSALAAIDRLELGEGTAIGEGIFTSVRLLETRLDELEQEEPEASDEDESAPATAIVVLSDGETTMGRPDLDAAQDAADAGIPVWTVSFGTARGEVVIEGDIIPVPVNEGALREVASLTEGEFFQAATADELQVILDDLGSRVALEEETREITDWFTGAGLVLTLLAAAGSLLWFSRMP